MIHYDLSDEIANCTKICEKVLYDETYAEDLYRALCNMQWRKRELMPLLRNELWSVSWRTAGSIVADLRNEGDYLDWYCSGREGMVSEEIRQDLFDLGWEPVEYPDDDY